MHLFESMADHSHEQVVFFQLGGTGLKAIVAIHNTFLGPALGVDSGCERDEHESGEETEYGVSHLSPPSARNVPGLRCATTEGGKR